MSVKRYAAHTNIDDFKSDWHESKDGPMVKYEDYAALEAKCAALAAESAGLNQKMNKLATWPGIEFYSSAWAFSGVDGDTALEFMCDVQTPATDAFLAEVLAQGGAKALEDFAEFNIKSIDPLDDEYTEVLKETARAARGFAAKIRKEAAQ